MVGQGKTHHNKPQQKSEGKVCRDSQPWYSPLQRESTRPGKEAEHNLGDPACRRMKKHHCKEKEKKR
jgi:hypothetical protein